MGGLGRYRKAGSLEIKRHFYAHDPGTSRALIKDLSGTPIRPKLHHPVRYSDLGETARSHIFST